MIKFKTLTTFVLAAGLGVVTLGAQQLTTKKTLNLAVVKRIAAAAEQEAMKNHWNMFITIVDDGGTVLYVERLDGAQIGSFDVSMRKAQTALRYRRPTKTFEDLANSGHPAILDLPGVMPLEGGIPLRVDGEVIGAIGVSGGASNEDAQVAQAGAAALEALLKK